MKFRTSAIGENIGVIFKDNENLNQFINYIKEKVDKNFLITGFGIIGTYTISVWFNRDDYKKIIEPCIKQFCQ